MHDSDIGVVGACPQCGSRLTLIKDTEGRKWAKCTQCGAQLPLEQGRMIVGSLPNKVAE